MLSIVNINTFNGDQTPDWADQMEILMMLLVLELFSHHFAKEGI